MRAITYLMVSLTLVTATPGTAQVDGRDGRHSGPTRAEWRRQQEVARRVPVTVALVDQLPDGVPAVILRRPDSVPHDVILLRRSIADGGRLGAAVMHLLILRERDGDTARVQGTFRLPVARHSPRAWERTEQVRAARVVARLRNAERREVPGIGIVPTAEIHLPSKAMRDAARQARRQR